MEEIDKRIIFLDSSKNSNGNYYDFNININSNNSFFTSTKSDESLFISPISFSVLNDSFNISEQNGNNKFTIKKTLAGSPSVLQSFDIILDDGFYSLYSLQIALQQEINTSLTNNIVGFTFTTSVYVDDITNYYTITINGSPSFFAGYDLYFEMSTPLAVFMGLETYSYTKLLSSSSSGFIISTKCPNFNWQPEIFIYSNLASLNFENDDNGLLNSTLFFSVPVNAPKNSLIYWTDTANAKMYETPIPIKSLSEISFKFVDYQGNPIYFQNWAQITLVITKKKHSKDLTKIEDSLELIKNYLEVQILSENLRKIEPSKPYKYNEFNEQIKLKPETLEEIAYKILE